MAQAEYLTGLHGSPPVLLIDDIMGELDAKRRSGFLPLLERAHQSRGQVFMTATEENWPRELGRELQRWEVKSGMLAKIVESPNRSTPLPRITFPACAPGGPQRILRLDSNVIMSNAPIRVAVTGAAGQIGYSLLFRIASGAMFGPDQPVILHLIEIEPALPALQGVVMELDDCAFPLLKGVVPTANLDEGFRGVNWALLVGSVPRKAGMERKDLLGINGKIFIGQGQAIADATPPATCACSSSAIPATPTASSP